MERIRNHFYHPWHFYAAVVFGALVFFFAPSLTGAERSLAGGDTFFGVYLATSVWAIYVVDADGLRKKAASEDEGIFLVILIALVMIGISSLSIITVLREKQAPSPLSLALTIGGVPLG